MYPFVNPLPRARLLARCGSLFSRIVCGAVLFFLLVTSLCAQEPVVLEFPLKDSITIPFGFSSPPVERLERGAVIEIPLMPAEEDSAVYLSIVFFDAPGTVLSAKWRDDGPPSYETLISENLSEGIPGWNQRTIAVPQALLERLGAVIIEANSALNPVTRISVVRAWPNIVYASPSMQEAQYIESPRRTFSNFDFAASVQGAVPDSLYGGVWKAVLQNKVEDLESPIGFAVPVDASPSMALVRFKILGAPLDRDPELWVNGRKLTAVAVENPELTDPGYFHDVDGRTTYAGWREVSAIIPSGLLGAGENEIVVGALPAAHAKEAILELRFDQNHGSPQPPVGDLLLTDGPIGFPSFENPVETPPNGPIVITNPNQIPSR